MSYNIGQYRRSYSSSYLNNINYTVQVIQTSGIDNGDNTEQFNDRAIQANFEYGKSYYVRIGIRRPTATEESGERISIGLKQHDDDLANMQRIDTITIPVKDNSDNEIIILDLTFSPNISCNQLVFILQRTIVDYTIEKRELDIVSSEIVVAEVKNIMNNLANAGLHQLTKIGVQGPPGLLMCINGQPIRVGPSGIYEIKSNYKITSIGFVVFNDDDSNSKKNYFILDYQY